MPSPKMRKCEYPGCNKHAIVRDDHVLCQQHGGAQPRKCTRCHEMFTPAESRGRKYCPACLDFSYARDLPVRYRMYQSPDWVATEKLPMSYAPTQPGNFWIME